MSFACWVYFTVVDSNDNQIFGHGETAANNEALHFLLRDNGIYGGLFGDDVSTPPMIVSNQWYFVVWCVASLHSNIRHSEPSVNVRQDHG